jgi:hypothetical protein
VIIIIVASGRLVAKWRMSCLLPQFKCQPDSFSIQFRNLQHHSTNHIQLCELLSCILFFFLYCLLTNAFVSVRIQMGFVRLFWCCLFLIFYHKCLCFDNSWTGYLFVLTIKQFWVLSFLSELKWMSCFGFVCFECRWVMEVLASIIIFGRLCFCVLMVDI